MGGEVGKELPLPDSEITMVSIINVILHTGHIASWIFVIVITIVILLIFVTNLISKG